METTVQTSPFEQGVSGLCRAILERPDFSELRRRIDTFMADEKAKFEYQMLNDLNSVLQQKQQHGLQITDEEIGRYEALRDGFVKNPVATEFLDAQQEMQKLQDAILKHVHKTFELGRVPSSEDMNEGNCGDTSCGCH